MQMPNSSCGWLWNRLALKRDNGGHHQLPCSLPSHRCPAGSNVSARPDSETIVINLVGEERAEEKGERKRKRMKGVKEEREKNEKERRSRRNRRRHGEAKRTSAPPGAE